MIILIVIIPVPVRKDRYWIEGRLTDSGAILCIFFNNLLLLCSEKLQIRRIRSELSNHFCTESELFVDDVVP